MLPASANYLKNIVLLDRDNRGIEAPSACHATPRRPVINGGCERPNNFHEPDWRHDEMTLCQRGALGKYDTRIRQALEIHIPHLLAKIILMISEGMTNSEGYQDPPKAKKSEEQNPHDQDKPRDSSTDSMGIWDCI